MKVLECRIVAGLVVLLALPWAGCSLVEDDKDPAFLDISIASDGGKASPTSPVQLTVQAVNRGGQSVSWGSGSSGCRLGAVVRVDGEDLAIEDARICVADVVEWTLAPGESRTETLPWSGSVRTDGATEMLPPGVYPVRGTAGSLVGAVSINVEVVAP